jgi:hypothetical protein
VVETGGLENRCTGNRTGGSNPSPSAMQSELQRIPALIYTTNRELCPFFAISAQQVGPRRTDNVPSSWHSADLFLWSRDE